MSFLRSLRAHNDRVWFNEHKDRYLKVREKIEILTGALISGISEFDDEAARLRPSDCLYRIYRDTRFSNDKTPYKTHIGIYINPPLGKKSPRSGYYLHLEPGNTMVAAGAWCPDAAVLRAIRQDIYDNIDEYLEIIENEDFRRVFGTVGEDLLKTAPKGFPKDWEYIELIKPRAFTCYSMIDEDTLHSAGFVREVLNRFKVVKPLNDFLNYTIDNVSQ